MGLEDTPEEYIAGMVAVFREVRRVLRDDGTLWLSLGDSYNKPKDLMMMPARVALALQADGWYLRSEIIWAKPNPMPESVTDRPTNAHEKLYLLSKRQRYYYDAEAVREASDEPERQRKDRVGGANGHLVRHSEGGIMEQVTSRNLRNVWTIATAPFAEAHFATFPPKLVEPCIRAGCPEGGAVLDPFGGAGTTGLVADRLKRDAVLIELNPEYAEMARNRIERDAGLFSQVDSRMEREVSRC
jgi:DNA modification methylase